jgi:hypothetical protein
MKATTLIHNNSKELEPTSDVCQKDGRQEVIHTTSLIILRISPP